LLDLGAEVHGFSQPPPTTPALFDALDLKSRMRHEAGDINDATAVKRSIAAAKPDYVFHLAAQPLVRGSYDDPVATYNTNVLGTIHVIEGLRTLQQPCAAV